MVCYCRAFTIYVMGLSKQLFTDTREQEQQEELERQKSLLPNGENHKPIKRKTILLKYYRNESNKKLI